MWGVVIIYGGGGGGGGGGAWQMGKIRIETFFIPPQW
jgi:hypothetical protein